MDNSFRENLLRNLMIVGGISSLINLPILYKISPLFAGMVLVFSLSYFILLFLFKNRIISYKRVSSLALFILFIQTLNIPVFAGIDTFILPWLLLYPMVVFSLKSNRYGLIFSSLLYIMFIGMFLLSFCHSSYKVEHIITFGMLYFTVLVVFYSTNINIQNKEEKLQIANTNLEEMVKVATHNLEEKNISLQESVDNFQKVLDTTMEAIVLSDENGKIIEVNQSGIEMFGYSEKRDIIGTKITAHILQSELLKLSKFMNDSIVKPYEITLLKKGGIPFPTLASARNIIRDGKKIRMSMLMDLTKIKEKEKMLQQQTRLAQMGEMISMIAHQWRQPLGAISSSVFSIQTKQASGRFNLEIKEEREKLAKFVDKKLHNIGGYVQLLSSTIDDFRNFFKPDKEKELVNITTPIKRALKIVESSMNSKNIKVTTTFESDDTILMYQNEMMQVILNIVKNAEDNFIEKSVKNPEIIIETAKYNSIISMSITDNGGGIPKNILPHIFDPYFSTKNEKNGTGLGLYMSKIMVEEHNSGRLEVLNYEDGVCFSIYL